MPETYVVHLGNSKELMEVAEDSVAKTVLREHVRESLGVRNDDLLFAIINSMVLLWLKYLHTFSFTVILLQLFIKDVEAKLLHGASKFGTFKPYSCLAEHHDSFLAFIWKSSKISNFHHLHNYCVSDSIFVICL